MRLPLALSAVAAVAAVLPPSEASSASAGSVDPVHRHNHNRDAASLNLRGHPPPRPRRLSTVTYPPELPHSAPLSNPERGFYAQFTYRSSSPVRLDEAALKEWVETGRTVILRMVYLDTYLNGPIGAGTLEDVAADFETMRAAGVKCVLRFAYTDVQGGETTDPVKSVVLNHIAQLKDVLTANQDAIVAVQAGFVGPWGEWHGSTNFDDDLEGRKAIVSALLDAVPDRNVQIRTPRHKQTLYAADGDPILVSSDHVADGGFEGDVGASWGGYMDGYAVESGERVSGGQSVRVTNGGARQWVAVAATEGQVVKIAGHSKRVGATGPAPWDYSIYADVAYSDNTYLWGQITKFSGDETWNEAVHTFVVPPGKTVVGMSLYCMYRNAGSGYALFDDVDVSVYDPPSLSGAKAIDSGNAFDGSHIARTGHHNDCFLASDTDYGTYTAPYGPSNTDEYDYLSQETKYTAMGGETCNPNPTTEKWHPPESAARASREKPTKKRYSVSEDL